MIKDDLVSNILKNKEWENIPGKRHIVSCGSTISFESIRQACISLSLDKEVPYIIVTSEKIWDDIKMFGCGSSRGTYELEDGTIKTETVELLKKSKRGVGYSLMKIDIYVTKDIPSNILIIGSKNGKKFSKVEVVTTV